jgi:hypothetical protein
MAAKTKAPSELDQLARALASIEEAEDSLRDARDIIRELFGSTLPPVADSPEGSRHGR